MQEIAIILPTIIIIIITTQTHNFNDSYKCDEDPDQVVSRGQPATENEYIKKIKFQKIIFRAQHKSNTTA